MQNGEVGRQYRQNGNTKKMHWQKWQKNACQYCQYCQFEGHKGRKNQETDKTDNTDKANFYIPVKMEEDIFYLFVQNYPK